MTGPSFVLTTPPLTLEGSAGRLCFGPESARTGIFAAFGETCAREVRGWRCAMKTVWGMYNIVASLFIVVLMPTVSMGEREGRTTKQPPATARAVDAGLAAALRLPFVENQGQVDSHIGFYAAGPEATVLVMREGEIAIALPPTERDGGKPVLVRERFDGRRTAEVCGLTPAQTRVNFYLGKDPAQWRTGVPTFQSLSLGEIYEGIALELQGHKGWVEQVFHLRPGADPSQIRIRMEGATRVGVAEDGSLAVDTTSEQVRLSKPIAYQEVDGARQPVKVEYRVTGRSYTFLLGDYDPARPLVIDPLLQATYAGGSGNDTIVDMKIAANGDVYIAGATSSQVWGVSGSLFPGMPAYIARLNSTLTEVLDLAFVGTNTSASSLMLAIHPPGSPDAGKIVMLGQTNDANGFLSVGFGTKGLLDPFLALWAPDLTLERSIYLAGSFNDNATGLVIHPTNYDVYVFGNTNADNFGGFASLSPPGAQPTRAGAFDAFVARLSSDLTTLRTGTFYGSWDGSESYVGLAINPTTGDIYVAGLTNSAYFPTTTGALQFAFGGGTTDVFVARFSADLTTRHAATYFGGSGPESFGNIQTGPSGEVFLLATTSSTTLAERTVDPGVVLAKLPANLNGPAGDTVSLVTLGSLGLGLLFLRAPSGDFYVVGGAAPGDFGPPETDGTPQPTFGGGPSDFFVALCNSDLTLRRATYLGGSNLYYNEGIVKGLLRHPSGDIYVAGYTVSTDFPGTAGGAIPTSKGNREGFVSRLSTDLSTLQTTYFGGSQDDSPCCFAINQTTGEVYLAGAGQSTDLPGTTGGAQANPIAGNEVFIARFDFSLALVRPASVGVFRPSDGYFYLDAYGNGRWDGCPPDGTDQCLQIGLNGDIPLVGDWNGTGTGKVGLFRPSDGTFYLDYNGNGVWDGCAPSGSDRCLAIGLNGDIPLVGDWNGTGASKVGAFRPSDGVFYLDYNGNGVWDGCGTDRCLQIGMNGDIPLVGDWNGSGSSKVGAFRPSDGTFYLDYNGSGAWDGCGVDRCLQIGLNGDVPLVGDWNGTGSSKVGAFRPADGTFYLDYNGSGTWEGCGTDRCLQIGLNGDVPLVGDWNGHGSSKVGAFRPSDGTFYLDYNGNGVWDGCGTDRCLQIGLSGDTPLVGKW
jgi:hypothetical protein